jgi:hypothetical protein
VEETVRASADQRAKFKLLEANLTLDKVMLQASARTSGCPT